MNLTVFKIKEWKENLILSSELKLVRKNIEQKVIIFQQLIVKTGVLSNHERSKCFKGAIEEGFRRSSSDVKMEPRLRKCCLEMDFGLPAAWPWGGTTRGATKENYYKYSRLCCLPGCLSSSVFNSQAYKDLGELAIEVKE